MFELIPFDRHLSRASAFDPFRDLEDLERRFFGNSSAAVSAFRTDVIDTGDAYVLEAELPGFSKENISLDIENDCLTITAERKKDENEEKKNYVKRERFYGSFSRSFDVSGINVDGITASYNDGILKLEMPKKVETVPPVRKLEIK
ncbi:MAG: Hsp20/alpha crystallin family protein [Oscillospiraceae bacterium]|nr:Hsp20/alpha crystallin family protein [Oscillospiraceae bacterium]